MKILVTNDDGINSEGLRFLVEKAKKYGDVIVVAPEGEQSGTSHSINIGKPISCRKSEKFGETETHVIGSTPADCVRYARCGLKKDFDIVFAGINRGYNLGEDILYSGTCGAIFEAAMPGVKGIAFSVRSDSFEGEKYFDDVMEFVISEKLLEKSDIYNVNIPYPAEGIKITKQGGCNFKTVFEGSEKGSYTQKGEEKVTSDPQSTEFDSACVAKGYISVTPLTIDRTNYEVYEKIKGKERKIKK